MSMLRVAIDAAQRARMPYDEARHIPLLSMRAASFADACLMLRARVTPRRAMQRADALCYAMRCALCRVT